jgi:carboxypeptidase D
LDQPVGVCYAVSSDSHLVTVTPGTGFATADADGYAADEDQVGTDFVRVYLAQKQLSLIWDFITSSISWKTLYKSSQVCPRGLCISLENPTLVITPFLVLMPIDQPLSGMYIPYIAKTYFGLANPPVRLRKIAIGDGTMAAFEVYRLTSVVRLESHVNWGSNRSRLFRPLC